MGAGVLSGEVFQVGNKNVNSGGIRGEKTLLKFGTANEEVNQYCKLAPFIISINDDADNQLSIVIALPVPVNDKSDYGNAQINKLLSDTVPTDADTGRMYEIKFESYVIYQCRNESYTCCDNSEVGAGKYLIIFEKSKLLDYYENVIFDFDTDSTKSKRKHYGIYTENHIIDVIANAPPTITKV